jgi:hypothetical protein
MEVQGPCTEVCPAYYGACEGITIKAEVLSDAEEEDDPLTTFPQIKAEPEVSCVSVSMLGGFHKCRCPSFYELSLQ